MKGKVFCLMLAFVVSAICWAEDPDYGSIPENAEPITADGSVTQGYIASGDEDWFVFTGSEDTLFEVTLSGQLGTGYTSIYVYQEDEFGDLHGTLNYSVWADETIIRTFFLEEGHDVYVKVYNSPGAYSFSISTQGQYPADGYSNDCSAPSSVAVGVGPLDGTLTHYPDGSLEDDWLEFNTSPMHKYRVIITKPDNTDVTAALHNEFCGYLNVAGKDFTVISWFGEPYRLRLYGNATYLGTLYSVEIIDLGLLGDDYSNVFETAEPITANGSSIQGRIEYSANHQSDEDWFVFTPAENTLYRVTLTGETGTGYTSMNVYQIDNLGDIIQTLHYSVWSNETAARTFFLEGGNDVYLRLHYSEGDYDFSIENLGQYPPDGYSNNCSVPTSITAGTGPIDGTLTHNFDGSLEEDWLEFSTVPMHKYRVVLTKSDNTDINAALHNESCQYLSVANKDFTVTSWFGEPYRLRLYGNAIFLGTYYTLEVIDLGLMPDDYPNIAENAVSIPKDGTPVEGSIEFSSNYHSDEDWFTFIAGQDGSYDFTISGALGKGYTTYKIYSVDELGDLHQEKHISVWADDVINFSQPLLAGKICVQVFYDQGGYRFSVVSPEPRCGDLDHPYPPGDANKDCYVNMADLAMMAENWTECTSPAPPCSY